MNKDQEERRRNIYRFMIERSDNTPEALKDAAYLMRQNHALRNIGLRFCNENMTAEESERLKRRVKNACKRCDKVASYYNCRFYYQPDPRGAAVYLMPQEVIEAHWKEIEERWGSEEAWIESHYYPLAQSFEYL